MSVHEFVARPGYDAIVAYRAERPKVEIDLSDSTNQFGVAPSALAALRDWTSRVVSEYPSVDSAPLAEAAAAYVGVAADTVVSGCGSDNLLDAAIRALAQPGDAIAHPAPTFMMIPILARINGLTPIAIPLKANGDLDAEAMLATRAQIMYVCTPNNPTGSSHSRAAIERVITGAPGVVIIDEAYAEFADGAYTSEAPRYPHVFSTRTLSKSFGLAGLRVGFGVGSPKLVADVLKSRGPYKVNAFAERAAVAALTFDRAWMRDHVTEVRAVRVRFGDALRSIGLAPLPSNANFLCVPVADARSTVQNLYSHGVAVRGFSGLPVIGDVLRIGLAPWPILERVRDVLARVLA